MIFFKIQLPAHPPRTYAGGRAHEADDGTAGPSVLGFPRLASHQHSTLTLSSSKISCSLFAFCVRYGAVRFFYDGERR